jgi:divalent metal cation (Fe/Co/Zn/Cd) transporter
MRITTGFRSPLLSGALPNLLTVLCGHMAALTSLAVATGGMMIANCSRLRGGRAPRDIERAIDRFVEAADGVRAVRAVRTTYLGPHAMLIVASVEFEPTFDAAAVERAAARIRVGLVDRLDGMTAPDLVVVEPAPVSSLP